MVGVLCILCTLCISTYCAYWQSIQFCIEFTNHWHLFVAAFPGILFGGGGGGGKKI
jgi:hypothetical protein